MKRGIELIAEERQRQIDVEGYSEQHDSQHKASELIYAAIAYAESAKIGVNCAEMGNTNEHEIMVRKVGMGIHYPFGWVFKPSTDVRDLVKAGALIAAAIDRILLKIAESEDEKIRHYLMNFVKINDGVNLPPDYAKKALAWLEKQKDCIKLSDSAYTSNRDVIEFADKYSHTVWEKLMDKFKKNENYSIGCNDVSDIVLNAIINTYNWLEKQGQVKESTISQHENRTCEEKGNSLTYEDERIRKWLVNDIKQAINGDIYNDENIIDAKKALVWLEKQGEPIDKIVKRAMNEKQRVLLTETNGDANIDWDTRSLQDVKLLLEYGLDYIKKLEKQGEQKASYTTIVETGDGGINALVTRELPTNGCDDERKPAEWSEEDEKMIDSICISINEESISEALGGRGVSHSREDLTTILSKQINWLKSIKDRVQPQPKQEWSEEDGCMINNIIDVLKPLSQTTHSDYAINSMINWLKSLRPQNHWKPSDEQIEALNAISQTGAISYPNQGSLLVSLYRDLKRLRYEETV